MALLIFALYLFLAVLEVPPLIHKREIRQVVIYFLFYMGALVVSVLLALQVEIPTPADPINRYINLIKGYLGG